MLKEVKGKMTPNGNMGLHKGMKNIGNSNYVGKCKDSKKLFESLYKITD